MNGWIVGLVTLGCALAALGAVVGTCSHELFMIASAVIGGAYGLAQAGHKDRTLHISQEPTARAVPPPS